MVLIAMRKKTPRWKMITMMAMLMLRVFSRGKVSAVVLLAPLYHWPPLLQLKGFFVLILQKATTTNPALQVFQPITTNQ